MAESAPRPVRSVEAVSPERFHAEIVPGNEPVLLKGQVAQWPAVRAGAESDAALVAYLRNITNYDGSGVTLGDVLVFEAYLFGEIGTGVLVEQA